MKTADVPFESADADPALALFRLSADREINAGRVIAEVQVVYPNPQANRRSRNRYIDASNVDAGGEIRHGPS